MVVRFIENSKIYLGKLFIQIIGLREKGTTDGQVFFAILLYTLFAIAVYYAIKRRDKIMTFLGCYLGISIFISFVVLQQSWGQIRVIIIYVPLILLFLSYGLIQLASEKKLGFVKYLYFVIIVLIFFKTLGHTFKKVETNNEVLMKNIGGNPYYGFTPDWINFLKMSKWIGKNLSEDVVIASRKPSMSFIYGDGNEFYGIYKINHYPPDTLINRLHKDHNNLMFIDQGDLESKVKDRNFIFRLKRNLLGWILQGNNHFGVFSEFDQSERLMELLNQNNIYYTFNSKEISEKISNVKKPGYGISPDELVERLRVNSVEYVILASLRINPSMKTERTINTVQRYLYYIETKYPGILTLVHQVGSNNDEPAKLYKINYHIYNMELPKSEK
jgi:hypothetical protein